MTSVRIHADRLHAHDYRGCPHSEEGGSEAPMNHQLRLPLKQKRAPSDNAEFKLWDVLDALDYDHLTGVFTWQRPRRGVKDIPGARAGNLNVRGYRAIALNGRHYYEQRLAWLVMNGDWPAGEIDHINGNRSDNRIANLRIATKQQNQQNSRSRITSGSKYKGVHWQKRARKWQADIKINGRLCYLGLFVTEEAAARAYDIAATTAFGEFARPNFPRGVQ